MIYAAHHLAVLAGCMVAVPLLARAAWPSRAPRTAILCWQALGLAWLLSLVGGLLALGMAPYRLGVAPGLARLYRDAASGTAGALGVPRLTATGLALLVVLWFGAALGISSIEVLRRRRRHRRLLALVGRHDPAVPGAAVIDHPHATAYCLPGTPGTIVVSAGALRILDRTQLAAVLAHEHAHLRERHDLVLLPFAALRRALVGVRWAGTAHAAVALLVEMRADDRALRHHTRAHLAGALVRFASAGGSEAANPDPPGALAAGDKAVAVRARRLLVPVPSLSWAVRATLLLAAAAVLATPVSLFVLPS